MSKIKDSSAPKKKAAPKERKNPLTVVSQYVRDVRNEFRKVIWPGRAEITAATIVVLSALVFFMLFMGVFDFIFAKTITAFLG
ncbi:MAG: preprotein translocase subunit SecE [Actinomycetota bacterium]|nr:preprotein translocase subunit SecE [Actinomycetota bacterium]